MKRVLLSGKATQMMAEVSMFVIAEGFLSVRIGSPGDKSEFAGVRGKEILHKQLGDSYHGFLSYDDLVKATSETIQFP